MLDHVPHMSGVASPAARLVADAEFCFTVQDFRIIAQMLRDEAGIFLPEEKASLVYARLAKRIRALGLGSFAEYTARLGGDEAADERRRLVSALTTNVTRFFREPHHFEHLRTVVLPPLLRSARSGGRVRLWSSACSTGEEPYSLASVIAELMPDAADLDVRVLATDIDPVVLEKARAGRYGSIDEVPARLHRWFEPAGASWKAGPVLRKLVAFRSMNLAGAWPVRGPFDAVLCRNVAIYFDAEVQQRIWQGFAKVIPEGGMLYLGHSERVSGQAASSFETVGVTAYRRRAVVP